MGLRDDNFLIDSDLQIIISSFERGLVVMDDLDSVIALFRKPLEDLAVLPGSAASVIDSIPQALPHDGGGEETAQQGPSIMDGGDEETALSSPELLEGMTGKGKDVELALEYGKQWLQDCVPCDFRKFTADTMEFWKDIMPAWEKAVDLSWENLKDFDLVLEDTSLESLVAKICSFSELLKFQCLPDIEKMLFLLRNLLEVNNIEFGVNLGKIDEALMLALGPFLNFFLGQITTLTDIVTEPIKCVINSINMQIQHVIRAKQAGVDFGEYVKREGLQVRDAVRDRATSSVQQYATGERSRQISHDIQQRAALRRVQEPTAPSLSSASTETIQGDTSSSESSSTEMDFNALLGGLLSSVPDSQTFSEDDVGSSSDSETSAEEREAETGSDPDARQQAAAARNERIVRQLREVQDEISSFSRVNRYLRQSINWLLQKKAWLLGIAQGFIDNTITDRWGDLIPFAKDKTDLLVLISLGKAIIDLAKGGQFSCGANLEELTEEDVMKIYRHLSDLPIFERRPVIVSDGYIEGRQILSSGGEEVYRAPSTTSTLPNIVVRRPISSCLKKVTDDEAAQVSLWISQLEGG